MRRFLSTSFIVLALVVSAVGAAPAAHAQDCPGGIAGAGLDSGKCFDANGAEMVGVTPIEPQESTLTAPADPAAASTPTGLTGPIKYDFNGVMGFIASLFAWLLGVATITLDNAVYYTVVTMGSYVHNLVGVGIAWRVLRDIGNIVLIFGFLAIGITTILNVDWYGGGKKMLPMLLVAAVFLNFSLFLSEAVIDTGNLFATQFYTQINGGNPAGAIDYDLKSTRTTGISNKIMDQLGLQVIYGAAVDPNSAQKIFENSALIGFMSIILFLIAAFVFFSLAFILIARFVILLFLIIIAPIGFAGLAIPQLKGTADKWWHALFEQTITAPVLLLLLYIALLVITDVQFLKFGSTPTWTGFVTGNAANSTNITGFASMILGFLIAMGLLLAVVIISKKLSAFGAAGATKLAGKLSFGATAWAGRAGVGTVIGRGVLGNRLIKRGAVSNNKLIRYGSRALSFTGKRLQNRTFDARNMPGAKTGLGLLNIDAGAPSLLTAKQVQEKQYGVKPVREFFRESSLEHDKAAAELDRKKKLADASATYGPTATPQQIANAEAARKEMKKMSTDELAALGDIRKGINSLVWNLSPSAFADLMKSDKLSGSEKKDIKNSWDGQFTNSSATAGAMIERLSSSEIASLSGDNLTHANTMPHLDASDFDAIRRKGDLNMGERLSMGTYILGAATVPLPAGATATAVQRQASLITSSAVPAFKSYYNLP